ncbi:hypothetical protein TNCT_12991 [Trichonephila clavata]|uniref:Uncharacterized protein n=1 Tax=Trichonephila clavata TaxID=2740835 RepID=A0A8X6K987_TRICU|nr:hypothetical protein TNCT_12991 [Trichonephila clavata]
MRRFRGSNTEFVEIIIACYERPLTLMSTRHSLRKRVGTAEEEEEKFHAHTLLPHHPDTPLVLFLKKIPPLLEKCNYCNIRNNVQCATPQEKWQVLLELRPLNLVQNTCSNVKYSRKR